MAKKTKRPKTYTISDGDLVLTLEDAGDGWFTVTSPIIPGLVTEAKTVPECFEMARDAIEALRAEEAQEIGYAKTAS
jgi:predicted RNase H-like HicB family nuclease